MTHGQVALSQPAPTRYLQVASVAHTAVMLAVFAGWSFWFKMLADHLNAAANPNRVRFYLTTVLAEWIVFALVVAGVRMRGVSILLVVGDRWCSARQVLRDIGIALGFWVVALGMLWTVSRLLRIAQAGHDIQAMLPHSAAEIAAWIALAVTAGICEETIFRGYLQRQFMALTQSAPAGILISAAAFGTAHAYQGLRMVVLISVLGAMLGTLAFWRGSVRPGMIFHTWQDALGGIVGGLMRH
jgi:membrane protease YdiL (CAAX protease family)